MKTELRDKALGVYSLKFESTLNPDNNRIESALHFTTTADKAAELLALGESTLAKLPQAITEQQIAPLRGQFVEQEKGRLKHPETWLNRLVLSERHLGDARYLREVDKLPQAITVDKLQATAKLLWNVENRRILIADPAAGNK